MKQTTWVASLLAAALLASCTGKSAKPEVWIYTSLYKDTIADIQPKLEAAVPGATFNFFQAGSEEVAAKVNAEELAGGTKADILIFSDRFWFEEMAAKGRLHKYAPKGSETVPAVLKQKDGLYSAVSLPIMVLIYNSDAVKDADAPKSFKEMAEPKWAKKFSTGSPLASGTNFTTVAFLQKAYGWDYFKALRKNEVISEGGNSAVIRRVQTKERPVGWVLLENALRLQESDHKLKVIYPTDGPIIQTNTLAIVNKADKAGAPRTHAEAAADWLFGAQGQAAMTRSFMYAAVPGVEAPRGARKLEDVQATAPQWTAELVSEFMSKRESIKEEFAHIVLQ